MDLSTVRDTISVSSTSGTTVNSSAMTFTTGQTTTTTTTTSTSVVVNALRKAINMLTILFRMQQR